MSITNRDHPPDQDRDDVHNGECEWCKHHEEVDSCTNICINNDCWEPMEE